MFLHFSAEMAAVHTSFTQVEVQILVFKDTLIKVEVLTKLLYSSKSKEGFEMYLKGGEVSWRIQLEIARI